MIYRIYKEAGRIGTGMDVIEGSLMEVQNSLDITENRTPLAALDKETGTIHFFKDKILDVSSLVEKFKNHCNPPNNHRFSILYK